MSVKKKTKGFTIYQALGSRYFPFIFILLKTNETFVAVSFPTFCVVDWKTSSNNKEKRNNHRVEHLIYWHPAETIRCEHQSLPPFKMHTAPKLSKKKTLYEIWAVSVGISLLRNIFPTIQNVHFLLYHSSIL